MRYLLDSNAVIALLAHQMQVTRRMRRHRPEDFGVSIVVLYELYNGAYRSRHMQRNLATIEGLPFETVALDREDAQ